MNPEQQIQPDEASSRGKPLANPETVSLTPKRINFFGLPLSQVSSLHQVVSIIRNHVERDKPKRAFLVSFINPQAFHAVRHSPRYLADLRRMDLLLSDGIATTLAARLHAKSYIERISFDSTSLALPVFESAARRGLTSILVGGRPRIVAAAAERISQNFPGIQIAGTLHGYLPVDELVRRTLELSPRVVVCGMGIQQQEQFLTTLADRGWTGCGFTCGGYFDQLVEGLHYYPSIVNQLEMRWAYRLAREPKRLARRYFVEYMPFWSLCAQGVAQNILSRMQLGRR